MNGPELSPFFLTIITDHISRHDPVWRFPEEKLEIPLSGLWQRSERYARTLIELGVAAGDRVGIELGNRSGFVAMLLAVFRLGAVAVPLRPLRGKFPEVQDFLLKVEHSSPLATIVYDEETDESHVAGWSHQTGRRFASFAEFDAADPGIPLPQVHTPDPGDTALIQYSSGSTGTPKGVIVTWEMTMAQLKLLSTDFERAGGEYMVSSAASWLPFYHDMGLFMGVMHPLYCGSQNLLASARYFMARPRRWFEHLSRQRVLLNFTTNSAMAFCLRQLERMNAEKLDLTRLHLYFGAEKVSPIVLRQTLDIVRRFSMPPEHIHVGYGMAENTLGAAGTLGGAPRIVHAAIAHDNSVEIRPEPSADTVELVSCGGSYLGVTITIRDDEDRTVGDLHLGEISVQSPCVTPGYINNPEATERALPEPGRLLTRDLGFLYDGELFFHARKDDLLIVGGRNIVPDDIEMTVEQLEFIRQGTTALVGIENSRSGTLELTLLIESKPELGPEEFKRRRTQARDVIYDTYGLLLNHIIFCEKNTIEKTSSGKKRRKVIRDRFVKDELTLY